MSFSQGISGLNAAAANLDVIGNNIANSSTVGFKGGSVAFKDIIAGSQIGLGTAVAAINNDFQAGSVQLTNRPLDLAITDGKGFFRLESPEGGGVAFSRNGQFTVDKDGFIVNTSGMRLTGYGVTANGGLAGGTPAALQFPTGALTPQATGDVRAKFNLDSRNAAITGTPFDPLDSSTYSYSNALTAYDSLGNPHEIGIFFTKTANNAWTVQTTVDGNTQPATTAITFDENGNLAAGSPTTLTLSGAGAYTNGSAAIDITIDLEGSTQFGNTSAVQLLTQDGYSSGELNSFEIGADGVITGRYSNEQARMIGQVVLSSFANQNGLRPTGNNLFVQTTASGQPLTGAPGSGSQLGAITAGALEQSNVDLTSELVNLIIAQRSYQANAQTLKTQDQVMQTLVNLR